ncbi:hypothetical protein I8H89_03785 [Candidatus Saccharibacteria bacterium]|nr:hypothetical protein [Candidatus Saccharibacteria bacterium]
MFEFRESAMCASDKLLYDDFSSLRDGEETYEGTLSNHPVIEDAYRLKNQLDNLVFTNIEQFHELIRVRVENLNERAAGRLLDFPVTIYAPHDAITYPTVIDQLNTGGVVVTPENTDALLHYGQEEEIEGSDEPEEPSDTLERDTTSLESAKDTRVSSLKGPFGGFAFRAESYIDEKDHSDTTLYKFILYARVRACFMENALADVTVFNIAELRHASLSFDEDSYSDDIEHASSILGQYELTPVADQVEALVSQIETSGMTTHQLKQLDSLCQALFREDHMLEEYPLQDSLIDLMKLYLSPEQSPVRVITPYILQLGNIGEKDPIHHYEPAQSNPEAVISYIANVIDLTLMPRTAITPGQEPAASAETLGLYVTVDLPGGRWGHIPVEHLKHIQFHR